RNNRLEALVDPRRLQRLAERGVELVYDWIGRALGEVQAEPGADVELGQALLARARQHRQLRRALRRQDRYAFHLVGFEQLLSRRAQRSHGVVTPCEQR